MSLTGHAGEGSDAVDSTIYNLKCDLQSQDSGTCQCNPRGDLCALGLAGQNCGTPPRAGSGGFGFLLWISLLSWVAIATAKRRNRVCSKKLEDCPNLDDPALLPDSSDISGRGAGGLGDKTQSKTTPDSSDGPPAGTADLKGGDFAPGRGVNVMPTRILSPRKFTKVLYDGPERADIRLHFQSSEPIDIYGVSSVLFESFKKDRTADLFRFQGKTNLRKRIPIRTALDDEWYLIMENTSNSPIAIHYEVFDA